jgi:hypothetical protein
METGKIKRVIIPGRTRNSVGAIMASTDFLSNYYLYVLVVGVLAASLAINWIAVHRSSSLAALLWGLLPFIFLWIGTYLSLKALECPIPGACEYLGLGHVVILFVLTGAAMIYIPLAYFMRLILRRLIWKGPAPPSGAPSGFTGGVILIAAALIGLIVASLITVLIYSGLFVGWHEVVIPINPTPQAGVPPEKVELPAGTKEHAKSILFAYQSRVIILTDQDRVLSGELTQQEREISKNDMTWHIEKGPPITEIRSYQMGCSLRFFVPPPPGRVVDRVRSRHCDSFSLQQAEYVILTDGSLLAWRFRLHLDSFLVPAVLLGPLLGFSLVLALMFRSEYRPMEQTASLV